MKKWCIILLPLLVFIPCIYAQNIEDKILMTVGNEKVTAGEFIRMYNKSFGLYEEKTDVDSYLQQFILLKQKVADAISEKLDTSASFKNEFNSYRNQLAQTYLTDNSIKEKLLKETYGRTLVEINAWHILINCKSDAPPADTVLAWKKAMTIRNRLIQGEPFEQVARGASDDSSVKTNGGNLGYITAFQLIAPIEDAVYNLNVGEISNPVRSSFGYHIIKVTDKRKSKGKILVAHIMKVAPPGIPEQQADKAKKTIDSIYTELRKGSSFSVLAKKCSDHKSSAVNGGKLDWFGAGEMIHEFSEAAFTLNDTGTYTKPVRTPYGWHIIKLLDKKKPCSYEEIKPFLENNLRRSYVNAEIKKSFVNKLKKEYNFKLNEAAANWFIEHSDTLIIKGLSTYNLDEVPREELFSFADKKISCADFANFVKKQGAIIITDDSVKFFKRMSEEFIANYLIKYEDSRLEEKYPEFKYLIREFHDGMLLFLISDQKVWNRHLNDSTDFKNYYMANKTKHMSLKNIETKVYTLSQDGKKAEKALSSSYRKLGKKENGDSLMYQKFNGNGDTVLTIREIKYYHGDNKDIDKLSWKNGTNYLTVNGYPSIVIIKKVNNAEPLPFEEVKEDMIIEYQEYCNSQWVKQLKNKYPVTIDNSLLDVIKKRISQR